MQEEGKIAFFCDYSNLLLPDGEEMKSGANSKNYLKNTHKNKKSLLIMIPNLCYFCFSILFLS